MRPRLHDVWEARERREDLSVRKRERKAMAATAIRSPKGGEVGGRTRARSEKSHWWSTRPEPEPKNEEKQTEKTDRGRTRKRVHFFCKVTVM